MKIKKCAAFLLAVALILPFSGVSAAASPAAYHWYVKRNPDGKQPTPDARMAFVEEYGGYFVDRKHGDNAEEKKIYLTFDAGYENGNVAKILDVLKEENVPGTFFILEHLLTKNTDLVRRMADEGHLVANHTRRHRDMSCVCDEKTFADELSGLENLYSELIGGTMGKFYRPPEGKFSKENMEIASSLGYKTIFWSFAYADWDNERQPDPDAAVAKILQNTHNGAIILLHPTSETNAKILAELISAWKDSGYTFGRIDELA